MFGLRREQIGLSRATLRVSSYPPSLPLRTVQHPAVGQPKIALGYVEEFPNGLHWFSHVSSGEMEKNIKISEEHFPSRGRQWWYLFNFSLMLLHD